MSGDVSGRAPHVDVESAAVAHLARVAPELTVTPSSTRASDLMATLEENGAEAMGGLAARLSIALQGFFHPDAGRAVGRDVRRLAERDDPVPARVADALTALASLPAGVHHGEVTPVRAAWNADGDAVGITGLDQIHHTAAVCDLAGTLAAVLLLAEHTAAEAIWRLTGAVLRGYQRHRPLSLAEADVLGELVLAHLLLAGAGLQADGAQQASRLTGRLSAIAPDALRGRIRRIAGLGAPGLPGAPTRTSSELLTRRRAVQGGSLSPLFYASPLDVVAGEGVWLVARDGRRYLDGYNNVAVVGHSHPSVVQAITLQAACLHTHSRYLHPNVVELAERLVASMPAGSGLDTCLFTTSGTEANELAWRLALEYTGGEGAIIGAHAYHGASRQMADLSSNEWPPGYHPDGVATFEAPIQDGAVLTRAEGLGRIAAAVERLAASGCRPAMVIADSMFTSEGVRTPPAEFMTALVDGAHAAGALFVADEVQVGFGRTGPPLWRFAGLGMRPDVVTLGKPMGAGYPIAAVLTRREIADALAARYEYFSTFAANPVGTAAALAVLDLLEDGEIPAHAVRVGKQLRARVRALGEWRPAIGQVRGAGLIAGIDLPSREAADTVKEALKDRGVLVGTTGRQGDVLKVRPPLVWQDDHVELFVAALAVVLAEVGVG